MKATSRIAQRLAIALIIALPSVACEPIVETHGFVPSQERLAQLQPGVQTKADVRRLLGAPSTTGTFDEKVWYYISRRTESVAFYKAEVTDQQVVAIYFDDQDVVRKIERKGLEDARQIAFSERETPTAGNELGLVEQLLGNLGRFNDENTGTSPQ